MSAATDGSRGSALPGPGGASRPAAPGVLGVLAVVLLATNLRPGATSVGPVLAEVGAGLGLSPSLAGLLTAVPGVAFAVFGALAVWLGARVGLSAALAIGALAAASGLLGRTFVDAAPAFLLLTVLAFAGMAVGNVLVPAYVKATYPRRTAPLMSVYTISLSVGATAASLTSVPLLAAPGGWRASLGVWGLAGLVAAAPWVMIALRDARRRRAGVASGARPSGSVLAVARSPKAIAMGVFFGMQSMQAYVQFGWFAQLLRAGGLEAGAAGAAASLLVGFGIPAGLVMPLVAARVRDARPVVWLLGLLLVAGWAGVLLAPAAAPWLWATCLGVSGFAFPFVIALIAERTRDPHVTMQLSGFAQSLGYVFSGMGPLLVGVLFDLTDGWTAPVALLLASAAAFLVAGLRAAAPGFVDDELGHARG